MNGLSKRQVILKYGFNARLVETLLRVGVLQILPGSTPLRPKIDPKSLENLREKDHYVVCQMCGAWAAQITTKHLEFCSGITLADYQETFPEAGILAGLCSSNKAKTETQKNAQSKKLKARFQTPEGDVTRKQIQEASITLQAGPYREKAATHLRIFNRDPLVRAQRGVETKFRWDDGSQRDAVEGWHRENRALSLKMAAYARRHIKRKRTKLHLRLKSALEAVGVKSHTEYEVGYYSIDEALPELKLAIEADGCYWHGCSKCGFEGRPEIHRLDKSKTTYLTRRGWMVLRFPGHDINRNPHECAQRVLEVIHQRRAA